MDGGVQRRFGEADALAHLREEVRAQAAVRVEGRLEEAGERLAAVLAAERDAEGAKAPRGQPLPCLSLIHI